MPKGSVAYAEVDASIVLIVNDRILIVPVLPNVWSTRLTNRCPNSRRGLRSISGAVPRVICPVHRGGRESHHLGSSESATLFGFDVCWAPGSRSALPLRFSVIFEYGGLIP